MCRVRVVIVMLTWAHLDFEQFHVPHRYIHVLMHFNWYVYSTLFFINVMEIPLVHLQGILIELIGFTIYWNTNKELGASQGSQ